MSSEKPTTPRQVLIGYAVDAVGPVVTYAIMHALGVSTIVSLILGGAVAVASTAINTIRRGKLDGVGILVLLELAASIAWIYFARDPRLLFVKPSLYTGIAGAYLIVNAFGAKPLSVDGAKPMATKGDPQRTAAFDLAWDRSAAFRAAHRVSTFGTGIASLADSISRVAIVYSLPLSQSVWLVNVSHFAAIGIVIGFSLRLKKRSEPIVDGLVQELAAEDAPT